MPITLIVNGQSFEYPDPNDGNWGQSATNWASAVTSGMLQKAGGNFTLLADANFGPSFGLISKYFTSISSNPASIGVLNLSNSDTISFRNGANTGDISFGIDSSNNLTFNGQIPLISSYLTGNLPVTHFNGGTGASNTTFLRGDGTWAAPSGSGSVNTGSTNALAYYQSATNAVFANAHASVDSSGNITANSFIGPLTGNVTGNVSGNSATCTTANTSTNLNINLTTTNTTFYPLFSGSTSGTQATYATTGISFNPSTNTIVATTFSGNFTGTANLTNPTVTTQSIGDNSTYAASTAFVQTAINMAVPTGTILDFAANSAPTGYLICNGSAVSRTTYSALFAIIGTIYGSRGYDSSGTIDPARTFGSTQSGSIQSHTHTASVTDPGHVHGQPTSQSWNNVGTYNAGTVNALVTGTSNMQTATTGITVTNSSTGGTETRPLNVAITKIIKY